MTQTKSFRLLRYQLRVHCRLELAKAVRHHLLAIPDPNPMQRSPQEYARYYAYYYNQDYTERYPFWTDGIVWT